MCSAAAASQQSFRVDRAVIGAWLPNAPTRPTNDHIMTKTATIKVDDANLAYRVCGEGPAIVLIRGIAATDTHWKPVISELARFRTVISLDYSGSGDTTDDGSPLSLHKLARQVAGVATAAGAEQFDLVGHSLGAAIAVELAASSPSRIKTLTLVAGFAWGAEPRLKLHFELWRELIRSNHASFLKVLLLTGLSPSFISTRGHKAMEDMSEASFADANWDGMARQIELALAVDIRNRARNVLSPTLVLGCAFDQIVSRTLELSELIPNAAFRQINAGHFAFLERADEFLWQLYEFTSKHGRESVAPG
jgi:pimeloyl-ACP methyl ester carboxylesterase